MISETRNLTLRSGEPVEASIVRAPDRDWADRLVRMLSHKGDPWNWQNSELLTSETGLDARFFVLHRQGSPFANIMLVDAAGAGILGHVWTEPRDRRSGASSMLMELVLEDFRARGGQALFLATDYEGPAWNYYRRWGFEPVERGSGYMARYETNAGEFDATWFGASQARVEPLDWPHWPGAVPLFLGPWPGAIRIAATKLIGRQSPEEAILPILRDQRAMMSAGEPGVATILQATDGPAVLGFASRYPDRFWPRRTIVDLYCHPRWWHRAGDLLAGIRWVDGEQIVAYCDADLAPKLAVLERVGLRPVAVLPRWIAGGPADKASIDVTVFRGFASATPKSGGHPTDAGL